VTAYRLTTPARRDYTDILHYLLQEASASVALKIEGELRDAFRLLAANPNLGHKRQDLTDEVVLFFKVSPYLVVYEVRESDVLIHAVVHGARDVSAMLGERGL
jgi:toxin ParE1/3/4